MLPGGNDPLYRAALAAPHRQYVRVEVWSGLGVLLEPDLVFFSGNLQATLGSRVTRTLSLQVHTDLYPVDPATDLLSPFGNEIRAYRGVELGDGSLIYTWQVFRGRIQNVTQSSDGHCAVYCSDRGTDVVDNAFVSPQNSQTTNTVLEEFVRLVSDAVPDPSFGSSGDFQTPVQQLTWQLDRGSALDELAASVGALWFALANGDFVLRQIPWTVNAAPVVTLTDEPGGNVNGWTASRNRGDVFNVVTLSGERLSGDAPVYATASDTNPLSPTYVDGGFGVRSLLERLQTPATLGGIQAAAGIRLADSIAPAEAWTVETSPDASLELGDVIMLSINDRDVRQVVSGFRLPMDLSGNMLIDTRSLVINQLEVP